MALSKSEIRERTIVEFRVIRRKFWRSQIGQAQYVKDVFALLISIDASKREQVLQASTEIVRLNLEYMPKRIDPFGKYDSSEKAQIALMCEKQKEQLDWLLDP